MTSFSTVGPLARLIWRSGPHLFITSAVLMLVTGALPAANIAVVSALLQTLVDAAGRRDSGAPTQFVALLVSLAAINLLGQLAERLAQTVTQLQGTRIGNQVQLLVADRAASVDLASFEDRAFHDEMQVISTQAVFRPQQMLGELMRGVSLITTLVTLGALLVVWHPWVVLVLVAASVATLFVSTHFGTAQVDLVTRRAELERRRHYLGELTASDQAAKEIRLFGLRQLLVGRLGGLAEQMYQQDRRLALRELGWSGAAGLVMGAAQVGLIAWTAFQALDGAISVGDFNRYMLSIVELGAQLPVVAFSVGVLHEDNLYARRLFAFLAEEPQVEDRGEPGAAPSPSAVPHLAFEDVCFRYPGTDRDVLRGVSFEADGGTSLAFVGENGAGKSTIVKLLAGLYEPTSGRIRLNGQDLRTLDRTTLRSWLSVIFQDFVVYHLPARDNVGFGRLEWLDDEERIATAARRSGLDRVVARLPEGFDTVLGRFWNHGTELSGGQRQTVALARALLRQAPVLALDEPSAALDARTEKAFFDRLLDGVDGDPHRLTLFVSHRLATVRRADRVLVLAGGRLVEDGPHDELMGLDGVYAQMYRLQSASFQDPLTKDPLTKDPLTKDPVPKGATS